MILGGLSVSKIAHTTCVPLKRRNQSSVKNQTLISEFREVDSAAASAPLSDALISSTASRKHTTCFNASTKEPK
jgi:hypothetical protein